jgi:hypothetical protein
MVRQVRGVISIQAKLASVSSLTRQLDGSITVTAI